MLRMAVVALCGMAATAVAAQELPGTITTHATARTRLPNTVADVTLGIEAHGPSIAAVQKTLASGSAALMTKLRGSGADRLRTEQVQVEPDTSGTANQPSRILGYTGQLRVGFRVDADKLGDVLGAALANGANTVDGTSLVPRESEVADARQALAAQAVRTALAQARAVAEAAGYRLGTVRTIMVDPGLGLAPRPAPFGVGRAMAMAAPVVTEAGESEVAATVSVVVSLQPGGEPPRP